MRSSRSNTVTAWPTRRSCCAVASPAGPEPMTATFLPVCLVGGSGLIQPCCQAWSMIASSMALIVTGSSLMPSTHAPSHGAGQTVPVNSGKLLVACSRSMASGRWLRYTRSFQSGMMLPSGQPWWQNGMPQSMQRAPCFFNSSSASGSITWRQSRTRSATGRYGCFARLNSMKPVALPMRRLHPCLVLGHAGLARLGDGREHALVILRDDPDELRLRGLPVVEQLLRQRRAGVLRVAAQQLLHLLHILGIAERLEFDHRRVATALEVTARIEHECESAGHAGGEVAPHGTDDDHAPAGHALAFVLAHALDDPVRAGISHREALAGQPAEIGLAAGGAVKRDVTDDDVLLGHERRLARRIHHQLRARQALADVVVGVALEREADALGQERTETLAGGAVEVDADGVFRQAVGAVTLGYLGAQDRADGAMDVANRQNDLLRLFLFQRRACQRQNSADVERAFEAVVLRAGAAAGGAWPGP